MGKKSTAQPRPKLHVPPRGIGPVADPNQNDVLCGRGGRINAHEGNVQFRDIVQSHKKVYLAKTTKKLEKAHIAARIVEQIRSMNPPGRFLKEDPDGMWFDIGDAKAIKKAGQALREDAPDIRGEVDVGKASGSEETPTKRKSSGSSKKQKQPEGGSVSADAARLAKKDDVSSSFTSQSSSVPSPPVSQPSSSAVPTSNKRSMTEEAEQRFIHEQFGDFSHNGFQFGGRGVEGPAAASIVWNAPPAEDSSFQKPLPRKATDSTKTHGGRRTGKGTITKHALEAASLGHPAGARGGGPLPPNQVAFGRNFTPTTLSGKSGASMSTISGFSGLSGPSATDTQVMGSALSLGSSGFGAAASQRTTRTNRTGQMSIDQLRNRNPRLNELAHSFMSFGGMARSRSFTELSAGGSLGDVTMSDASLSGIMQADKSVFDGSLEGRTYSALSGNSLRSASTRSRPYHGHTTAMSVASTNSVLSAAAKSTGSSSSWLQPIASRTAGSICSDDNPWLDDRSCTSDVSENLLALDLAMKTEL